MLGQFYWLLLNLYWVFKFYSIFLLVFVSLLCLFLFVLFLFLHKAKCLPWQANIGRRTMTIVLDNRNGVCWTSGECSPISPFIVRLSPEEGRKWEYCKIMIHECQGLSVVRLWVCRRNRESRKSGCHKHIYNKQLIGYRREGTHREH